MTEKPKEENREGTATPPTPPRTDHRERAEHRPGESGAMAGGGAASPLSSPKSEKAPITLPKPSVREWIRAHWLLDEELPENEYYLRIATRYRVLKYAAILLTLALLLGMMAIYSDDITVDNFRYLLRDLDRDPGEDAGIYETIRYDSGSDLRFAMYKGDLVVLRPGQTAIYTTDSRTVMNEGNGFYAPSLLSADKYFLAYDPGQTTATLTLYNAFSPLHTLHLDRPIYGAALSDEGIYAVVSDETGYRGVVSLYDADFDLITKIMKDKYIWDVDFSRDGERLAVLSAYEEGGEWMSEVHIVGVRSGETLLQTVLSDTLGYACAFTSDGTLAVMSGEGMRLISPEGEEHYYHFGGEVPVGWAFGDSCQAVYFNRTILGQEKVVRILQNGSEIGRCLIDGRVVDSLFLDQVLYLLTETHLYRIDPEEPEPRALAVGEGCLQLLAADETHLLLCYRSRAEAIHPLKAFVDEAQSTDSDPTESAEADAP